MSYEQEWVQHQALLKEVERLNKELQVAETARNAAIKPDLQNEQQAAPTQLEGKVDRLREEKATAETRVAAFELQVAQTNPEHAQWLSEQHPPVQENKSKEAYIDVALTIAEAVAEKAKLMDSFGGSPVTDPIKQVIDHTLENKDVIMGYTAGWVRDKIETVKEYVGEKAPEKEELMGRAIVAIPESFPQEVISDEKKELRTSFDKEFNDMYNRHEKAQKELTEQQLNYIRQNGQTPEMAAKFSQQQQELQNQKASEFNNLENRECREKADLILKEWKNDIDQKEQIIKAKADKELENAKKSFQNQADQIEKRYDGKEKEDKLNLLKEAEKNVEKNLKTQGSVELELKNIEERKTHLDHAKQYTKDMGDKERLAEVEKQRELDRQRELERQRQMENQNRNR